MLLNLILLLIIGFLSLWIIKLKNQVKYIHKHDSKNIAPSNNKEEFSLGMSSLNSDFKGKILTDPLTNLPGREAFEDRLAQAINQSGRFKKALGVMFFAVDDFELINKKYGYEVGDKVIIEISKRLQKVVRQIDTLTRFGGSKFIVLLPQLALPETAAYVAQRLLDSVALPFLIEDHQIMLTGSVGAAIYPEDGHNMQTLLHSANEALDQARTLKGHYQFYRQEMHALGQRELSMHAVFSSDDFIKYLAIHYQPQINTKTGEVVAIQAAPVLQLPEYGEIAFEDFARTAENCKKAIAIWEWLLNSAIIQFKKWRDQDIHPKNLIIDVTYSQIQDPQFIYKITQILQDHQLETKELIFEVVEKDLAKNSETIEKSFDMLKNIDIQIGLSIFALGRLALHKITKLPVTYLKIDANLIKDSKDLEEYENVLQTLISLAQEMQINVIAESVENDYQKELLENLGCVIMQGKLFSETLSIK